MYWILSYFISLLVYGDSISYSFNDHGEHWLSLIMD
jgi:hypothetical protein